MRGVGAALAWVCAVGLALAEWRWLCSSALYLDDVRDAPLLHETPLAAVQTLIVHIDGAGAVDDRRHDVPSPWLL